MARRKDSKPTSFILDSDLENLLEKSDNKTRTINDALRLYFAYNPPEGDLAALANYIKEFHLGQEILNTDDLLDLLEGFVHHREFKVMAAKNKAFDIRGPLARHIQEKIDEES